MNVIFWEPLISRTDIESIRISKAASQGGSYNTVAIANAQDNANPPAWIGEYLDLSGLSTDYYKYAFLDDSATPIVLYESGEIKYSGYATLAGLIAKLRFRVKDINPEQFAFTFWELKLKIENAINEYNYQLTYNSLAKKDETPVLVKAHIDCCYELATNSAKYYRIHAGEGDTDKSQRVVNYTQIAQALENNLERMMDRQGLGLENTIDQSDIVAHKYPALYAQTGLWQRVIDTRLEIPSPTIGKPTPTISNIQVPIITSISAIITWETNIPSDTKVEWWIDPSDKLVSDTFNVASGVLAHSVELRGLNPSTTYYFRVYSGATVSSEQTFISL